MLAICIAPKLYRRGNHPHGIHEGLLVVSLQCPREEAPMILASACVIRSRAFEGRIGLPSKITFARPSSGFLMSA